MATAPKAGAVDKRRLILDAAVRVFARRGFHTSRVGDIAEEAGVAHGLLYHYFASKEQVLETVFRDNWTRLVAAFEAIDEGDEPPRKQLEAIATLAGQLIIEWTINHVPFISGGVAAYRLRFIDSPLCEGFP